MSKTFSEVLNNLSEYVFTSNDLLLIDNRIEFSEYLNRWNKEIDRLNKFDMVRLRKENTALSIDLNNR